MRCLDWPMEVGINLVALGDKCELVESGEAHPQRLPEMSCLLKDTLAVKRGETFSQLTKFA